jgi:hypothetical protein
MSATPSTAPAAAPGVAAGRPPARAGFVGMFGARQIVTGLLAVIALGMAVAVGLAANRWFSLRSTQADQTAALAAARQAFTNSLSFDYRDLNAEFATLQAESTGPFLADLRRNEPHIRATFTTNKLVASAAIAASAVSTISPTKITVIVAADETIRSATTKSSADVTPQRWQVLITMVQRHGQWLVDDLKQVA